MAFLALAIGLWMLALVFAYALCRAAGIPDDLEDPH